MVAQLAYMPLSLFTWLALSEGGVGGQGRAGPRGAAPPSVAVSNRSLASASMHVGRGGRGYGELIRVST